MDKQLKPLTKLSIDEMGRIQNIYGGQGFQRKLKKIITNYASSEAQLNTSIKVVYTLVWGQCTSAL